MKRLISVLILFAMLCTGLISVSSAVSVSDERSAAQKRMDELIDFYGEDEFRRFLAAGKARVSEPTAEYRSYTISDAEFQEIYANAELYVSEDADFSTYFTWDSGWITRSGIVSLQLFPKSYIYEALPGAADVRVADAWEKVVHEFGRDSNWYNETSLYDQYKCHWTFARDKEDWCLEPHRPVVSWAAMIVAQCNPE